MSLKPLDPKIVERIIECVLQNIPQARKEEFLGRKVITHGSDVLSLNDIIAHLRSGSNIGRYFYEIFREEFKGEL